MIKRAGVFLAVAGQFMVAGCAGTFNTAGTSEYGCPGMPAGVVCKQPFKVYEMSNGDISSGSSQVPSENAPEKTDTSDKNFYRVAAEGGLQPSVPKPVRVPPQVMRIMIFPWTDKNDDLHWPSYLFTEIQPRRWNFGKPGYEVVSPVIPHRMVQQASPSIPPKTGAPRSVGKEIQDAADGLPQPDGIVLN